MTRTSQFLFCFCWIELCIAIVVDVIRKRLTSAVLAIVMLTAAAGVGAHQHEGVCPMMKLPDCCKKAQSNESGASIARICCNLNCSEPASSANSSSSSFSVQPVTTVDAGAAVNNAAFSSRILFTPHLQRLYSYDSNPRYIKHLALLI